MDDGWKITILLLKVHFVYFYFFRLFFDVDFNIKKKRKADNL